MLKLGCRRKIQQCLRFYSTFRITGRSVVRRISMQKMFVRYDGYLSADITPRACLVISSEPFVFLYICCGRGDCNGEATGESDLQPQAIKLVKCIHACVRLWCSCVTRKKSKSQQQSSDLIYFRPHIMFYKLTMTVFYSFSRECCRDIGIRENICIFLDNRTS